MGCRKLTYYQGQEALSENCKIFVGGIEKTASGVKNREKYYSGGMPMPNANNLNLGGYRFGFNTQESDAEITGAWGSHYSAEHWMYDSRLMRRWNVDPVPAEWESPYAVNGNNPIFYSDPDGDIPIGKILGKIGDAVKQFGKNIASLFTNKPWGSKGTGLAGKPKPKPGGGGGGGRSGLRVTWPNLNLFGTLFTGRQHRATTGIDSPYWIRSAGSSGNNEDFGLTFGLRRNNFVFFDFKLGRTGRKENYFPGLLDKEGNPRRISFMYSVPSDDPTRIAKGHLMFLTTKLWTLHCVHAPDDFDKIPHLRKVNDSMITDIIKSMYRLFQNGLSSPSKKKRYQWLKTK